MHTKTIVLQGMRIAAAMALWVGAAEAALRTETVEYNDGPSVLEGHFAYDDASSERRPGILVVHEWKGLNDYAKYRAETLAGMGYAALAVDMYGKGIQAKDHEEAAQLSGIYRNDRQLMRKRILAALEELKRHPQVDAQRIAAIGYCFGGTTVLELARSAADVRGVASFHGGLSTPQTDDAKHIKGRVLVFHGQEDPFIKPEEVTAFEKEMKEAGVDYQLVRYPGAVHSFTVPSAGDDPSKGMAYNADADHKSWQSLMEFLSEILK